ncbi:MAG: hypothetical protein QM820_63130 [Minicystis sp.]
MYWNWTFFTGRAPPVDVGGFEADLLDELDGGHRGLRLRLHGRRHRTTDEVAEGDVRQTLDCGHDPILSCTGSRHWAGLTANAGTRIKSAPRQTVLGQQISNLESGRVARNVAFCACPARMASPGHAPWTWPHTRMVIDVMLLDGR